jgi:hypothetical protein
MPDLVLHSGELHIQDPDTRHAAVAMAMVAAPPLHLRFQPTGVHSLQVVMTAFDGRVVYE